jgi:TusA-related sulfurtransferase
VNRIVSSFEQSCLINQPGVILNWFGTYWQRPLAFAERGVLEREGRIFEMEVAMPPVEHVDQTLDCLNLLCPVPIIKISKAVKGLQTGQTLLMLADDPGAKPDVIAWAKQTGNELVGIEEDGKVFKFYVRKTK